MRDVYFRGRSGGGPIHSLYKELLKHPPHGYRFLTDPIQFNEKQQLVFSLNKRLESISYARDMWREAKTLQYMAIRSLQAMRTKPRGNSDLVYASQQLIFDKTPLVADFEYANALVNYGDIKLCKRFVGKALSSRYCKKVLPWSNWAKRTLYHSLNCKSFQEKIETVHFGIAPKVFVRKKENDRLRLLFVGSINLFNFMNFEWKGGFEVVDAFLELNKQYDGLELVVRSWVPPEIKEKCANNPNIKVIHSRMSDQALARLYASSDIVVFPAHLNLGMAILEAMSYELPVIARAVYDVPEAVEDMKTGVLLSPLSELPYYVWNGAPNHYDQGLLLKIRQCRPLLVKQIVEKVSLLIEDSSLRRKLGREARRLIEYGEFSIKNRNEKLRRIFDEATGD